MTAPADDDRTETHRPRLRRRPSERKLTARQRTILLAIDDYTRRFGYPPTLRELGDIVGLSSASSVQNHILNLQLLGYLQRDPNRPRTLRVLRLPVAGADSELGQRAPDAPTPDSQQP